jgi:hypothetical protein
MRTDRGADMTSLADPFREKVRDHKNDLTMIVVVAYNKLLVHFNKAQFMNFGTHKGKGKL